MRIPLLVAVALLLSGCGVPPAVSAASWVADGISLVASGKSITDHGISIVVDQDCAIFRVVRGDEICRPYVDEGVAYADAGGAEQDGLETQVADAAAALAPAARPKAPAVPVLAFAEPNPFLPAAADAPSRHALFTDSVGGTSVFRTAGDGRAAPVTAFDVHAGPPPVVVAVAAERGGKGVRKLGPSFFFVVGSFESRPLAERLVRRLDEFPSRIIPGVAIDTVIHRVAVGPIPEADTDAVRRRLRAYGIGEPWVIDACGPYAPAVACPAAAAAGTAAPVERRG